MFATTPLLVTTIVYAVRTLAIDYKDLYNYTSFSPEIDADSIYVDRYLEFVVMITSTMLSPLLTFQVDPLF